MIASQAEDFQKKFDSADEDLQKRSDRELENSGKRTTRQFSKKIDPPRRPLYVPQKIKPEPLLAFFPS
jgi:hypothetical protein